MQDTIISLCDVSFAYDSEEKPGTPVLQHLSLEIGRGQFVAILGHNGCGKSTLAKLCNAILVPTSGKVLVDGIDTADESRLLDIRSRVGMVFQNPDNQIVATVVEEDVAFALENLGVEPQEIRKRVDEALKAVGMYEYREHAAYRLSGGQKQRVAIAGTIAMRPACIVLDEPTAMLDPKGRREVLKTVRELNQKYGITVLLITHYMDEAAQADRVVLPVPLSRGKNLNCTAAALPLCGLFALLRPEQRLYAGGVKAADREAAAEYGLTLTDYLSREELAVRNGVPTAEGAIEAAMAATDVTLFGTPCLVIGFGRIGKLLAHRLRGLGAEVTVSARRLDDLAWIDAFGYRGLRTNRLAGRLGSFRVVFNTVPSMVLTEELLRELPRECVLLELASQPGFDRAAAEARGLKCIAAPGLPGRAAPETAARAIKLTLEKIWEEEA